MIGDLTPEEMRKALFVMAVGAFFLFGLIGMAISKAGDKHWEDLEERKERGDDPATYMPEARAEVGRTALGTLFLFIGIILAVILTLKSL